MKNESHFAGADDFVIAIDFGGTKIALATADMTGTLLILTCHLL
jgi:predicted NBD/HSP70 family sugar kinase